MLLRRLSPLVALVALVAAAAASGCAAEEETNPPLGVAQQRQTVDQARAGSCSTTTVQGLNLQIIAQANCINAGTYVKLPAPSNVHFGAGVYPYMEQPAKDAWAAAVADKPTTTMTVNSVLRTVAQQYLLYQWYLEGRCGISLAATPGNSNHESGIAFDVEEYSTWKATLENHGFAWLGSSDVVHYDYKGPGSVDYRGTDVKAFQMLWNFNHPTDLLTVDGDYGPQTEARLKQAPADGFPTVPNCTSPDVQPSISLDATDVFTDGSSAGVADLFEGDVHTVDLDVVNKGGNAATVDVGIVVPDAYLPATAYEIQSDWMHPGTFMTNEANDDPANPDHAAPGSALTIHLHQLSPSETKRVVLTVTAKQYSLDAPIAAPAIQLWVKDIPSFYHQDAFDQAPTLSKDQTFNGGVLAVTESADVYSRTRWEWNTDRLEGWTPTGDATIAVDGQGTLLLGSMGADPGMQGPTTQFAADDFKGVSLRAKRTGGAGKARLYFATLAEPAMDEDKAVAFTIPDDDAFHALDLDVSQNAKWKGTITALRVDPFESDAGSVEFDYLRLGAAGQGGGSGGRGAGGGGGGPGAGGHGAGGHPSTGAGHGVPSETEEDAGCGCSAAGSSRGGGALFLAAALPALALLSRRRSRADKVRA